MDNNTAPTLRAIVNDFASIAGLMARTSYLGAALKLLVTAITALWLLGALSKPSLLLQPVETGARTLTRGVVRTGIGLNQVIKEETEKASQTMTGEQ